MEVDAGDDDAPGSRHRFLPDHLCYQKAAVLVFDDAVLFVGAIKLLRPLQHVDRGGEGAAGCDNAAFAVGGSEPEVLQYPPTGGVMKIRLVSKIAEAPPTTVGDFRLVPFCAAHDMPMLSIDHPSRELGRRRIPVRLQETARVRQSLCEPGIHLLSRNHLCRVSGDEILEEVLLGCYELAVAAPIAAIQAPCATVVPIAQWNPYHSSTRARGGILRLCFFRRFPINMGAWKSEVALLRLFGRTSALAGADREHHAVVLIGAVVAGFRGIGHGRGECSTNVDVRGEGTATLPHDRRCCKH